MTKRYSTILFALACGAAISSLFYSYVPSGAVQEYNCQTFRVTGKTICGRFLSFWERNGGVLQFGYPISDPFIERSEVDGKEYTVQYFERTIFELHPENKAPNDVLLALLGTLRFRSKYPNGEVMYPPNADNLPLYPGAKNINVVRNKNGTELNITEFTTADKPESILSFYKDVMPKNGWRLERTEADLAVFHYPSELPTPTSTYIFIVQTLLRGTKQTYVKVTLAVVYNSVLPTPNPK
jgi:hypothetical protein